MKIRWMPHVLLLVFASASLTQPASAQRQTDLAASLYGNFTPSTTSGGVAQTPANAAGGLLELRDIFSAWAGMEITYAYNRANQTYTSTSVTVAIPPCPTPPGYCPPPMPEQPLAPISANAHTIAGDFVFTHKIKQNSPRSSVPVWIGSFPST